MKSRLSIGFAAILCLKLVSCYPYVEPRIQQGPRQQTSQATPQELRLKQEQEMKLKAAEEELKRQQANLDALNKPSNPSHQTNPPPSVQRPNNDYPFANKVPGKDGFVFSPYNNKVVDVRDIPSGTLVQDPTYPASEKKYFRVP